MSSAGNKPTSWDDALTGVSLELYNHLLDTGALQSEDQQTQTVDNITYSEKVADRNKRVLYGKSLSWSIAKTHCDNDEGGSGENVIDDTVTASNKTWSSNKINSELNSLETAIDTEENNREAADTAIQNSITSEANTRLTNDNALQTNINAEATARANADTTLQSNIDTVAGNVTDVADDLSDEVTARANADTTLQNNIDDVADDLSDEVTARTNADSSLQTNISAEATTRANADTALQTNINTVSSDLADEVKARRFSTLSAVAGITNNNEINITVADFTSSDLVQGLTLKLLVTDVLATSSPTISINGTTAKEIKATRAGSKVSLTAHTGYWQGASSTSSRVWDAYTSLDLIYDGTDWVIIGNPVLCSYFATDKSYSVYSNGEIEQTATIYKGSDLSAGETWSTTGTYQIVMSDTGYTLLMSVGDKGGGGEEEREMYATRTTSSTKLRVNNRNSSTVCQSPSITYTVKGL
jgi:hypothetical protein